MDQPTTHFALATLLIVGLTGCAADRPSSSTTKPMKPVIQSQSPVIEGQVVRNEDNAYVIRELSGRQPRVAFDRKIVRDNIVVGDTVAARFDGLPSSTYATSITRGTGKPTPPSANTSPRFQTVEGIVRQQDGNDSPHLVQGEVVRTDENGYVVRDFTGRDVRLRSNSATVRNDDTRVGDRIIADTGSSSAVHVESDDSCFFRIVTHEGPFYRCFKRYSEHLSNCGQATHDEIANWCIPSHVRP